MRALELVPLGLEDMDVWDPKEEYWGDYQERTSGDVTRKMIHGTNVLDES
jgi:hypothetical protein